MAEPPVVTRTTWPEKLRGWLFVATMLISAFFGTLYILMPLKILIFVRPRLYRRLVDRLVGFWLAMPSGLMEYLFGVKLRVTGTVIDRTKPALIIMNHRTRLDWLFFWNALFRIDPWLLTTERISLKGILKHVPGAGWAMASQAYMFLDRSFEKDAGRIDTLIDYYAASGENYQLLLFVEGTDKCPLATGRSKAYAEKMQFVHYDYVLHPRLTGFAHIVQKMRRSNYLANIYDVTVGFPTEIVQSEVDLGVLGASPKNIHFDIRRVDPNDLPKDDAGIGRWLTDLWREKEERLRRFYDLPTAERRFDSLPGDSEFQMSFPLHSFLTTRSFTVQMVIVTAWTLMTFLWTWTFFNVAYQYHLGVLTLVFFLGCQRFYGGLEQLLCVQLRNPSLGHWFGTEAVEKPKKT